MSWRALIFGGLEDLEHTVYWKPFGFLEVAVLVKPGDSDSEQTTYMSQLFDTAKQNTQQALMEVYCNAEQALKDPMSISCTCQTGGRDLKRKLFVGVM